VAVQCDEEDSKGLLRDIGVPAPQGRLVRSAAEATAVADELGGGVYVKALSAGTSRAARGGIRFAESAQDAAEAFEAVTTALDVGEARVEAAQQIDLELYLSVGFVQGGSQPELLFSREGGSGIEGRAASVHRVQVDPLVGLRPFHVRQLLSEAGLSLADYTDVIEPVVRACYDLVIEGDALLVELNPLAVVGGEAVALDARITLDDYAVFRHPEWQRLRASERKDASVEGELAALGIAYVPLDGDIGVVGLGAGLTMQLADWITNEGGRPAFFFDATTAAVRDHASLFAGETAAGFTEALRAGLGRVAADTDVLLVNFTSGGTPVNGLSAGLLSALADLQWSGDLVVHVAGNRQEAARSFLRENGVEPQPSLGAAVRIAVKKAAER
jgi:succinyl-CoA synthetase beta subunit